jgi:hypothetical protein
VKQHPENKAKTAARAIGAKAPNDTAWRALTLRPGADQQAVDNFFKQALLSGADRGKAFQVNLDDVLRDQVTKDSFESLVTAGADRERMKIFLCNEVPYCFASGVRRPDTRGRNVGPLSVLGARQRKRVAGLARELAQLLLRSGDRRYGGLRLELADLHEAAQLHVEKAPVLANEDIWRLRFLSYINNSTESVRLADASILLGAVAAAMEQAGMLPANSRALDLADQDRLQHLWQRRRSVLPKPPR